jgi:glycosyltransferase involved in cell wall biosynthesis
VRTPASIARGLHYRVGQAWFHGKRRVSQARKRRQFAAWLSQLRSRPPDVLIGANFDLLGGVGNHIHAICRYSSLRVGLVPSDELMRSLEWSEITTYLSEAFQKFSPEGIRAVHSHVFPWFIGWCRTHRRSGVTWIHTYHLNYLPEHAKEKLAVWQEQVNDALINDARHADVRISITRWQQQTLEKQFDIRTVYVPNGVDVAFCDQGNGSRFVQHVGTSKFVLYAGRNDPVKNPADFVRLAHLLPKQVFVMIGHGVTREVLQTEWGVDTPDNLYVYGPASYSVVQDALAACSALVVTSKREGLPTLVLEAMAHRKAVVVPDDAGCVEAIGDERCGFIYRQSDLDGLAEKTLAALADRERGPRARRRVLAEYDWRVIAPQLDALYRGQVPQL